MTHFERFVVQTRVREDWTWEAGTLSEIAARLPNLRHDRTCFHTRSGRMRIRKHYALDDVAQAVERGGPSTRAAHEVLHPLPAKGGVRGRGGVSGERGPQHDAHHLDADEPQTRGHGVQSGIGPRCEGDRVWSTAGLRGRPRHGRQPRGDVGGDARAQHRGQDPRLHPIGLHAGISEPCAPVDAPCLAGDASMHRVGAHGCGDVRRPQTRVLHLGSRYSGSAYAEGSSRDAP